MGSQSRSRQCGRYLRGRSGRAGVLAFSNAIGVLLVLACASGLGRSAPSTREAAPKVPASVPAGSGTIEEFLASGHLADGSPVHFHPSPDQMPWRIAVPMPKEAPQYASRRQARAAVIEAMQEWERALQTELPWFHLAFVEEDASAPVQVLWKRRIPGDAQGYGGPRLRVAGERVLAGGELTLSVRACEDCETLTVDEVRLLAAHEFGHVLGLGHCLECDSIMSYDWGTRDRVFVTRVDVEAFATLCTRPNPSAAELLGHAATE